MKTDGKCININHYTRTVHSDMTSLKYMDNKNVEFLHNLVEELVNLGN